MVKDTGKLKFYNLGSEKLDLFKSLNEEDLDIDYSKKVTSSKGFNAALLKIINTDLKKLSDKTNKMVGEIKSFLITKGVDFSFEDKPEIENIFTIIETIDQKLQSLIVESNVKVGMFSLNKKKKKKMKKEKEDIVNFLSKYQADFMSMKNEYEKLLERKALVKPFSDELELDENETNDPLERTINFFVNKN